MNRFLLAIAVTAGSASVVLAANLSPDSMDTTLFQDGQVAGSITPGDMRILSDSAFATISAIKTASYTLTLPDRGTTVELNLTAGGSLTIPPHSSVAFDVGTKVVIRNTSLTNQIIAIMPGTGVAVSSPGSLVLTQNQQQVTLWQRAQDVWVVFGSKEPKLINSDYALTTTDGVGATNSGQGIKQIWGDNGTGTSGVSCGPGPGQVNGTGTLSSRLTRPTTGGPTNGPYRAFNVVSGDNWGGFGVRCEIGFLEWRFGEGYNNQYVYYNGGYTAEQGTFALFKEGQHRITDFDIQLESTWTLSSNVGFQEIAQWKQAQPNTSAQSSGSPIIEINARNNLWQLNSTQGAVSSVILSSTPATLSTWYHIRLDCNYSQFTALGWCQMIVTPWSGGVLGTPVVLSVASGIQTLAIETGGSGINPVGSSIPSALLIGTYVRTGAPSMACDITNIQVWDVT